MTIHCQFIAFLLPIHYVTLWRWQLSYMVGHVINPSTTFEHPMPIHSSVTSQVFHCIPLMLCLQTLRNVHAPSSCDLCIGGKFYPLIWNPQPHFVYSLRNFGGSTMKVTRVIWQNNALPRCTSICTQATWPWPSDPEQLSHMVGHVNKFATKLEDPMPIHSWVEL